jgi:ferredoxin-fold anticodon binding domain-containing protein
MTEYACRKHVLLMIDEICASGGFIIKIEPDDSIIEHTCSYAYRACKAKVLYKLEVLVDDGVRTWRVEDEDDKVKRGEEERIR